MSKLFMINVGGSTNKSNIEVHDILFVAASSIEDTFETVRQTWYGTKESVHIDSYKELKDIDGFQIELSKEVSSNKLFMITYGGHNLGEFSESHKIHFVNAQSIFEAESKARNDLNRFDPMEHIDSVCDVQAVLLGDKQKIKLIESHVKFDELPDWHGYLKL